MKKNKLAIITANSLFYFGGSEKFAIEIAKKLNKKFKITILSKRDHLEKRVNKAFIKKQLPKEKIIEYDCFKFPIIQEYFPKINYFFKLIISLKNFSTIYNIDASFGSLIILNLCKLFFKTKIIFVGADPYFFDYLLSKNPIENKFYKKLFFKYYLSFKKNLLKNFDVIQVINSKDEKLIKKMNYKNKLFFIPNFIYDERKINTKRSNSNKFIVLFVGRLDNIKHKGLDFLKNIIDKVLSINKEIEFHIVGSGDGGENIINELVNKYPKNIYYKGFLTGKALDAEYENATIFVLTSRFEGLPLVVLEAQAKGLPVISFDIPGSKDVITAFSGSLIKPFDIQAFSDKILEYYKLWKKNKLNIDYKKRIIDYAFNKYSNNVIIPKIEKMLTD